MAYQRHKRRDSSVARRHHDETSASAKIASCETMSVLVAWRAFYRVYDRRGGVAAYAKAWRKLLFLFSPPVICVNYSAGYYYAAAAKINEGNQSAAK